MTTSDARIPNRQENTPMHDLTGCPRFCTMRIVRSVLTIQRWCSFSECVPWQYRRTLTGRRKALDHVCPSAQMPSVWLAMCRTSGHFQTTLLTKESTYSNIRHIIVSALTRRGRSSIFDLLFSLCFKNNFTLAPAELLPSWPGLVLNVHEST